jgi:ABC-type transport system involved in cytochrome bd biosynthesis fused ATPase/permease subunit
MSQRSVDNLLATSNDIEVGQKIESEISRVTAENLTVSWGESFMQPVSFDLSKGEILVVRGRSGSGKSTLAMGLLGLLPYEGSLTFDGNDADGFSDLNSRIVGTVQRSHIFNTSLRENLKIANQEATDTELIQVLTILELDQLLNELAEGLDTVIGDFGRVISGGEAKRLSVARVLLAKADVYILDEPTEHLDDALAGRIEKAIAKRLREKITIVITHTGWEGFDKTLTMRR